LETGLQDAGVTARTIGDLRRDGAEQLGYGLFLLEVRVDTVGDLVKLNRNDLLKFRNFGKKSLTELDELLTRSTLSSVWTYQSTNLTKINYETQ